MAPPLTPTQLTPPRVAVIDERTGAISREWYRFFLSLLTATQITQDENALAPDTAALLASYTAMLDTLAQTTESQPQSASVEDAAVLQTQAQDLALSLPSPDQSYLASVQTELQALALSPPPKQQRNPRYGSFYSTATQPAAAINTAYGVTFNTTSLSSGVWVGAPTSRIYVDTPNVYNIQFSAQIDKTRGGVGLVWIWLRKNGVDVPDTSGQIRIQGNNAEVVPGWNYVIPLNAGDYIELMWEVDDTSVQLLAEAATAIHPAIPSIILTVTDNISTMGV